MHAPRPALRPLVAALLLLCCQAQAASRARFLGQQQRSAPATEQASAPTAEVSSAAKHLCLQRSSTPRPGPHRRRAARPLPQPSVTAFDGPLSLRPGLAAIAGAVADAVGGRVPWLPSGLYSGDGTAYSEAVPNTGQGFACSYRYLNDWASTHFAAINRPMVSSSWQHCLTRLLHTA